LEKIAILITQETHLDQTMTDQLHSKYKKNLKILILAHPTSPHAKAGMGFVLNKKLIKPNNIKTYELIPGRAMIIQIKWMNMCDATILNIYVPNERKEHATFWAKIITKR
jgi:exonuclease III